jgi:hypothetical protein
MKKVILALLPLALLIAAMYGFWLWFFCRFYVGPDQMAIITAKSGTPLREGQLLADADQKGIRAAPVAEGRHFLNPVMYDWEIRQADIIPAGKVGIVTAKVGDELPEGVFIAEEGQKGIRRGVLGPGKYRLNPYGYTLEIVDAISIPIGYVGVLTSLSGEQPDDGAFAGPGQKGVREDILQPGLYYVNPKELKVDVLEIGLNQVSLLGKLGGAVITKAPLAMQNAAVGALSARTLEAQQQTRREYADRERGASSVASPRKMAWGADYAAEAEAAPTAVEGRRPQHTPITGADPILSLNQFVEFPSRDGFEISLDMTVEFELQPGNIAWIYRTYGDLPAVVDKIIMPQILSVSRLKGSAYRAKDFIVGEGREKFQTDLTDGLRAALNDKRILIHNALIRHVNVPDQILSPIQEASIAVEQDLTNKEKQNTARKQAELNTEQTLIEQRREQVAQETEKLRAEIMAGQEREVAQIQAGTLKKVAEIEKTTATVRADKTRILGQASAQVVELVEGEKAKGFELKTKAFRDPQAFAMWEFARALNPRVNINILHAGDGTLWTDLQKATTGDLDGAVQLQKK